jgi:hypothetical protein
MTMRLRTTKCKIKNSSRVEIKTEKKIKPFVFYLMKVYMKKNFFDRQEHFLYLDDLRIL